MSDNQEPKIELTQVFARTSRGQAEALDTTSALTPMLRHLLILLDGRANLGDLQGYYPHKDITVAALLLWHHGYAEPVLTTGKLGIFRKLLWGKSAQQVAPQVSSGAFADSLQSVFPNTQGDKGPRFSVSGKYWFSQGGRELSKEAQANLQAELDELKSRLPKPDQTEHIDVFGDDAGGKKPS